MRSGVADLPQGSLPASFGFQTLPSLVFLRPGTPFGPGITAQACDESGNVLNPIGEGAQWLLLLLLLLLMMMMMILVHASCCKLCWLGFTAQAGDEFGSVINPIGEGVHWLLSTTATKDSCCVLCRSGITAQACDEFSNVLNPIGEGAQWLLLLALLLFSRTFHGC
jgi:hypothetical protein